MFEIDRPDTRQPAPGATMPEVTMPEVTVPGVTVSDASAPEVNGPRAGVLADDELLGRVDGAWVSVGRAHRELLDLLREVDRREAWRDQGAEDISHWVSLRYGVSSWKAARWVEAARALGSLPLTATALADGTLGIDQTVELTRFATPQTEAGLVRWAAERASGTIRRRADLERRREREEVVSAERSRFVHTWYSEDGTRFGLEASLPADQGAVVDRALSRLAEQLPADPDPGPDREGAAGAYPLEVRRADALVMLCAAGIGADPDPDRATVVVHVEARTLLAEADATAPNAEVEHGPVLAPETARRLACDARLQVSLDDASGTPLMLGRLTRTPSAPMVRALRRRDRTCRFPGCGRARYTNAHHVVWWSRGGRTDLANLVLLCGFHHRLVHEGGWRLRLGPDAVVSWFRPDGRRYRAGPAPPTPSLLE
jgi:hypothetical protein